MKNKEEGTVNREDGSMDNDNYSINVSLIGESKALGRSRTCRGEKKKKSRFQSLPSQPKKPSAEKKAADPPESRSRSGGKKKGVKGRPSTAQPKKAAEPPKYDLTETHDAKSCDVTESKSRSRSRTRRRRGRSQTSRPGYNSDGESVRGSSRSTRGSVRGTSNSMSTYGSPDGREEPRGEDAPVAMPAGREFAEEPGANPMSLSPALMALARDFGRQEDGVGHGSPGDVIPASPR